MTTQTTTAPPTWLSSVDLPPYDSANAALLRNVAPANWQNPTPQGRYHLVVIGAGTAGLVSAAIAVGLGAKVAIVERHMFGGDCLNFGCVPSKAIISAARAWHAARTAQQSYGGPEATGPGDFSAVMTRMRTLRASLSEVDSLTRFRNLGVDVFRGVATFADKQSIDVDGVRLNFRKAIIATGARASVPPISGLADTPFLTNETIFSLTERPSQLLVIGAGPIGAELAQAFARLGSSVTMVHSDTRILSRDDPAAAQVLSQTFAREGIIVHNSASVDHVTFRDGEFVVRVTIGGQGQELVADQLLVATGRQPNIESLNLTAASVAHTKRGIHVNDRLRTSNTHVYAIGDVSSALQFTHVADAQARLAVPNALFFGLGGGKSSSLLIPRVTYTSPEVAHVGLTPDEALAKGVAVDTIRIELAHNDRAQLDGHTEGFLAVHLKRGSDTILGGTLVAEQAGEMIGELAVAIKNSVSLSDLGSTIHAYPTQSEVYRRAADTWRRGKLTPFAKRAFATWFRIFQ